MVKRMKLMQVPILLMAILLLIPLTSCSSKDGSGVIFKYDIPNNPQNLDPQSASDYESLLIIENVFEGLLKVKDDGKLTEGMAIDYKVSDDGLKYEFNLREDALWIDKNEFEARVTAHDFVFAFKRLFDPTTNAPLASKFYCIKNAKRIHDGKISRDEVGVYADGDYRLIIELDYPNTMFLNQLVTAPAMPCNEEYFYNTGGKYGLDARSTPSNGAFYLTAWNYDRWSNTNNHLVLRRNYEYANRVPVYPFGLNFFITKDINTYVDRFVDKQTDSVIATSEDVDKLTSLGHNVKGYENTTWGLIFNSDNQVMANKNLRNALSLCTDRATFASVLNGGFTPAYGIVPPNVTILDKGFRDYAQDRVVPHFSHKKAEELYAKVTIKDLESFRVILPESLSHIDYFSYIAQQWQKNLNFFCTIEELDDISYQRALTSGDYDMALVSLTGDYNSPEAFLSKFTTTDIFNKYGQKNSKIDSILKDATKEDDIKTSADAYKKVEKMIIDEAMFIPLYYQTEYFVQEKNVADIEYNSFSKSIFFGNAKSFE